MSEWLVFALAGFAASFVDGALGMGFGPTSSSILLATGLPPASVSASVNISKVATGFAAAVSHWRFRNIDHGLVLRLALPGVLGAVGGIAVLSLVDGATLKPILAALLMVMGLRILARFARPLPRAVNNAEGPESDPNKMPEFNQRGLKLVAACGGVTNGMIGAWGPVVTPFLLHRGLPPRFAIGSVNTAEVAVAGASAASVLAAIGSGGVKFGVVAAMLIGGVVAAPLAAWTIRFVPARAMGIGVSALLLLTNARELAAWSGLTEAALWIYAGILALVTLAALAPRFSQRARAARIATTSEGEVLATSQRAARVESVSSDSAAEGSLG
jgi:hypothetical protein